MMTKFEFTGGVGYQNDSAPFCQYHDAYDSNARLVQIKTTQGSRVGISEKPDYLIVLRMSKEGEFEETYNGPGGTVWEVWENP